MHRLYIKHFHENGFAVENYDFYKRIFTKRFRSKFKKLKKEICNHCTNYKNLNEVTEERENTHKKDIDGKIFTRALKEKQKKEAR